MFKSSFSKYVTAYVIIITLSFLVLSAIITTMVKNHVTEDKEEKLELSCSVVANYFEDRNVQDINKHIDSGGASALVTFIPLVNLDYDFNILITDANGNVLLSTVIKNPDGSPSTRGDLGVVNVNEDFSNIGDDEQYLYHKGDLGGILSENCLVYGKDIVTDNETRGYVFTSSSTQKEDRLIRVIRNTLINSSIWVVVAAIVVTMFITERLISPLRTMTKSAKKFGEGDFSERVAVRGHDEVAQLSLAFNNMADSLENMEKMRNSFLASVSHDLRTPMTTISGFIDGITSGAIPPEKHDYYLGIISSEVHRLSRLVSLLLDVSRLESGERKINNGDFDVAEMARIILISFEKEIEEKSLNVEFDSEDDVIGVFADKDAIHQVLYNLCHNAIKFSSNGGKFIIKIARIDGKKVRISVYDDGQIIPDEDVPHIFDRFYKTDKSRGLDKTGVGLGLYICKTIINAHGEEIGVINQENGCEFWFTLKAGETKPKHKQHVDTGLSEY